ncbi:hypothetical protein RD110_21880 [Rhodoferax koreense]|uniref:Uncharacterized protein n=1 Tax=Rhodoferax koreensis TaxID=1842727 RepID=A0A1P8K0L1_9BURK|nr:hypothetical protein [Rhodoferax koreense]APW39536.1 hypothetical protein RD110_21880 [Rhodoferax koreense]
MESASWSLRNKLEDIERALTQGSNVSARMAAHELSIRLCHTTTALQLEAEGMNCAEPSMTDGQARLGLLSRFGVELDRLIGSLRDNQPSRAAEATQLLFGLLAALHLEPTSSDSYPRRKADS